MKRRETIIRRGWQFTGPDGKTKVVHLPHTWNNVDGQDGGNDYFRGTCTYTVKFPTPDFDPKTESVYLEFDGVNATADVNLNGSDCCHHDGGYSTFRVDVTDLLSSRDNNMTLTVDNSVNDHVYPQKADFTFYGGVYRDVKTVVVNKKHISMDYYGGPGVKVTPVVEDGRAKIAVESWNNAPEAEVAVKIKNAMGQTVAEGNGTNAEIILDQPHLWDGLNDPYLYTATVELSENGELLDDVSLRFGVRSFYVDPEKGFFLNGKSYPLHGVSRHQNRKGVGNAITNAEHEEDLMMIREVGANTIRLAHYQHSQYFYDRCDEIGFIVWAEIPYISEHMPNGRENTISQMHELITQNYHHASIVCWGVSNEITISTKDKADMLDNHHVLNDLCHKMDPTRLTTLACYAMCGPFNKVAHITDLVGWNLYLGWYIPGLFLNDLWISFFHKVYPKRPLCFSEYGCEAMPNLHSDHPHIGDHSEEYQLKYHEFMLRCFQRHPYMWAYYVWNMFDFAADARDQGGEPGMNHKGLVTFDRKTKKDSFYLYKAFWSEEPFVYIAGKRKADRTGKQTKVSVFTNQPHVKLYNNGELVGESDADRTAVFTITLQDMNRLEAVAGELSDKAVLRKVSQPNPSYKLVKVKNKQKSNWV
ncbi:MAG: glycoside hydrolase family 2 protein [Lachnospiraceae bacterium]|nr:glycoside hydrolase family 2 protein [Lachnospiraceae bacterium]